MFVQNTTALSILMRRSRYVCRHGRVKLFCHVSEELPMYMNNLGNYIGYRIVSKHHPQNRMWECTCQIHHFPPSGRMKVGKNPKKDTAAHWNPMSMHQFLHLSPVTFVLRAVPPYTLEEHWTSLKESNSKVNCGIDQNGLVEG
jgi:hypothetical protein